MHVVDEARVLAAPRDDAERGRLVDRHVDEALRHVADAAVVDRVHFGLGACRKSRSDRACS